MLKSVLSGLLILVAAVFAFVAYNGYAARKSVGPDNVSESAAPERTAASLHNGSDSADAVPASRKNVPTSEDAAQPAVLQGNGAASTDSLPAQPTEGEKFGTGNGRYQLYRQGDMTWRLNVETGESCILLATDEQWHKERVYRSGCRGHE